MRRNGLLVAVMLVGLAVAGCGSDTPATKSDGGGGGGTGTGGAGTGGGKGGSGGGTGTGGATDAGATDVPARNDAATEVGLSPAAANVAKACSADTDCGPGLQCLKPTDQVLAGTGGPAHGYCTVACTDDATCAPLGGYCIDYRLNTTDPPEAYCLKSCVWGDLDRTSKCQGRPDVGCQQDTTSGLAACVPMCSQDVDCPTGRKCDLRTNVCVDSPSTGDRMGVHCTADATGNSTCAGICLQIGTGTTQIAAICTSNCVAGELAACSWVPQAMSVAGGMHGVCDLIAPGAAAGDVGYCTVECDTANDCPDQTDPSPICDTSQQTAIGHGICSWAPASATDGGRG
jgi:hypothetical protein